MVLVMTKEEIRKKLTVTASSVGIQLAPKSARIENHAAWRRKRAVITKKINCGRISGNNIIWFASAEEEEEEERRVEAVTAGFLFI